MTMYIKQYEGWFRNKVNDKLKLSPYQVDDYVIFDANTGCPDMEENRVVGKISNIEYLGQVDLFMYDMVFANGKKLQCFEDDIFRKAYEKEIEEYKLEEENPEEYGLAKKYNL